MGFSLFGLVSLFLIVNNVEGHGRLIDPPGRSSMWRYGFDTPANYDDAALYCGGFNRQWNLNGGRCGVCGDPFDGPRDNEAGGKYAQGVIVKRYQRGQTITVTIELTKSHLGWFEFRLCQNNNPRHKVTQRCLNSNLLRLADGSTRYQVRSWTRRIHRIDLRLPFHVTCRQCVLQWKYNAGNSWGCFGRNTHCCIGCGHQEQFYGCADVAISASGNSLGSLRPTNNNNGNYNNQNGANNGRNNADRFSGFSVFQRVGENQKRDNNVSLGSSSFLFLFQKRSLARTS